MMVSKQNRQAAPAQDAQLRILTEHEAALRLSLGRRTLQEMRLRGDIPFVRLGDRRVGYALADLEAWVAARRENATSSAARA